MSPRHSCVWIALLFVIALPVLVVAELGSDAAGTTRTESMAAEGTWSASGESAGQRWTVAAVRFADKEIRGRVTLDGAGPAGEANVEARLSGRGVVGKLLDDEGRTLAVFEGAVRGGAASGTFRHVAGGSGTWAWDGKGAWDTVHATPAP
jgi:hypothetical protein